MRPPIRSGFATGCGCVVDSAEQPAMTAAATAMAAKRERVRAPDMGKTFEAMMAGMDDRRRRHLATPIPPRFTRKQLYYRYLRCVTRVTPNMRGRRTGHCVEMSEERFTRRESRI